MKKIIHFLLAVASYWYYGRQSRKMVVIGVTGTKGKSTTSRLIASVLEAAGHRVGLLSTVEFQIAEKRWLNDKKMTMLGRGQIQKMLKEMVNKKCTHVVIETSSEGILQYRHYGLNYDVAVFTNLGREHSERHGGFENLRRDKGKLFDSLSKSMRKIIDGQKIPKISIANGEDKEARYFLSFKADQKYAFTFSGLALQDDVKIVKASKESDGGFRIGDERYTTKLPGVFNLSNALAAVTLGKALGIKSEFINKGLETVDLVQGRMEFVDVGQPFKVVVDYAHEPLSLTALFSALRHMVPKSGRVIGVVGSDGGGRDKSKREIMGEISGKLTDFVVITDVNCYDEDPHEIAKIIAKGARKAGKRDGDSLIIDVDRKSAIDKAFSLAGINDIVVLTAKGTEPYIGVSKGKKIPWDDRQIAREILSQKYVSKKPSP